MIEWTFGINDEKILALSAQKDKVEVDFSKAEALSSFDFKNIVVLSKKAKALGKEVIFKANPELMKIFKELGIDQIGIRFI